MGNVSCLHHAPSISKIQHISNVIKDHNYGRELGKRTKIFSILIYYGKGAIIFIWKKLSSNADDSTYTNQGIWESSCKVTDINVGDEESITNLNFDNDATAVSDTAATVSSTCRHPKYDTIQSRIDSFVHWPTQHPKNATELAEAGFFYTGRGDRVICFHCGGGVKDWFSGDSPWVEHAIWFGDCEFLVANKGQQFVDKVKFIAMQNANKNGISKITAEVHEYKKEEINNKMKNDEVEEMTMLKNARTCKICFEKELSILFLPCGHLTACAECAPKLQNCPICRLHPVAYIRAHLP